MGKANKGWLLGMRIYLATVTENILMTFIFNCCFAYEKKAN